MLMTQSTQQASQSVQSKQQSETPSAVNKREKEIQSKEAGTRAQEEVVIMEEVTKGKQGRTPKIIHVQCVCVCVSVCGFMQICQRTWQQWHEDKQS